MAYQKPGRGKGKTFSGQKSSGRGKKENFSDRPKYGDRRRSSDDSYGNRPFSRSGEGSRRSEGSFGPPRKRKFNEGDSGEKPFFKGRRSSESFGPGRGKPRVDSTGHKKRRPDFESREERPKAERRKSAYYGKPFGKPESRRKPDLEKKSFVESRLSRQRKFIREQSADEVKPASDEIRLNKFISNSGICSRREADNLISMGLVSVNGQTITEMGYKVKRTDDIRYEGKRLTAERPVYILMNKPKGFITTTEDPQERNTVMNLIAGACKERVYPVGRLDRNTTGLLLFTNDGELAEKLTHPSYNVRKIYKVDLDHPLTKADFQKIKDGVRLEEGRAVVDDLAMVDDSGKVIGIELHIGWNRIVRRIFESLDYQVIKLDRVVYAGLDKKDLPRGKWRFLKDTEVIKLKHFGKK